MADRAVDLPLEAEAAAASAALADLQQRHVPVLGVRRLHGGDRAEGVHVAQPPLGDHGGRPAARGDVDEGAVLRVADVVALGDVDTRERRQQVEEARPVAILRAIGGDQLADQLLALADDDEVHERRDGLGIGEGAHAAHQHERILRAPLADPKGDAGEIQDPQDVDVVPLIRDREADHVEVAERPLGLQRERRRPGPGQLGHLGGVGKKDALADDVR